MKLQILINWIVMASALCPGAKAQVWVEVRSRHFIVDTDAGERRGREIAKRFEQTRAIFGSLLVRDEINQPVPLGILAFRDRNGLQSVAPMRNGRPEVADGIFLKSDDKDFIALDLSAVNDAEWPPALHGYARALLDANFPTSQPWFDEGFAQYFSTIKIEKKDVLIGTPPAGALQTLRNRLLPVQQLFATSALPKEHDGQSGQNDLFSAESWLVVHYLYEKKIISQASTYFDLRLNQKVGVSQAISQAFNMTPKDFDAALQQHLAGLNDASFKLLLPYVPDEAMYELKRLKQDDITVLLADIHSHSPDHVTQSVAEFETVLGRDPINAEANRGLGYAYLQKGDHAKAIEYFQKAAAQGSSDPRVHYLVAKSIFEGKDASENDAEALVQAAAALDEAIRLDSAFAEAFNLRGFVMAQASDSAKSIEAFKEAVRLQPRDEQYKMDLANEYLAAEKFDAAIAAYDRLAQSPDPKISNKAKTQADTARHWKADPLLRVQARNTQSTESPQWQPKGDAPQDTELKSMEDAQRGIETPDPRPIRFLKGQLLSVDCSQPPRAVFTVKDAQNKSHKFTASSQKKLIIIGGEEFSCTWKDRRVSVNFRANGTLAGDIVSLELY